MHRGEVGGSSVAPSVRHVQRHALGRPGFQLRVGSTRDHSLPHGGLDVRGPQADVRHGDNRAARLGVRRHGDEALALQNTDVGVGRLGLARLERSAHRAGSRLQQGRPLRDPRRHDRGGLGCVVVVGVVAGVVNYPHHSISFRISILTQKPWWGGCWSLERRGLEVVVGHHRRRHGLLHWNNRCFGRGFIRRRHSGIDRGWVGTAGPPSPTTTWGNFYLRTLALLVAHAFSCVGKTLAFFCKTQTSCTA